MKMRTIITILICVLALSRPAIAQPTLAAQQEAAKQAMAAGNFDEAARRYRDLLKAVPNEPGLLMNFGMALAMGGHAR